MRPASKLADHSAVLLVSEELRGSREAPATLPPNVISYKTSPDVRAVLAVIETLP